jgi:hypothetical protein
MDSESTREEGNGSDRELYSNYFRVGFNSVEFLLDFGRQFEDREARLYQRIITAPAHAKEISLLLAQAVRNFETKFGSIRSEDSERRD